MKILIKACANGNYGDDLFILSILNRYADYFSSDDEVILLVYQMEKYSFLQDKYNNISVKLYPIPELWQRIVTRIMPGGKLKVSLKKKAYQKAYRDITGTTYDVFINVGGSLLAHFEGEKFILSNWLESFLAEKIVAKRKYLLNVNFQANMDESFKKECKNIISKYDDVCFRDRVSYEMFSDIKQCRMAPDMVLSMKSFFQANKNKNINSCVLGINAIDFNENKRLSKSRSGHVNNYEHMLVEVAKAYLENGYEIWLFAFDDRPEEREYIHYLKRKIIESYPASDKRIRVVEYSFSSVESFANAYSCCTRLITTRFHAVISALLLNINFYPIVYDEKISNFLKTIDFSNSYSTLENLASTAEILDSLEKKPDFCYSAIDQGDDIFLKLDQFMKKGEHRVC